MNISQLAIHLNRLTNEQDADATLANYLHSFGFRHYAFTYYAGHIRTGRKLRYHCVSDALRPWHLHYLEQSYADVDRTLEENQTQTFPLFWDIHTQLAQAKNKREYRMRQDSFAFGVRQGLSIPLHGPHNDFISVTLHQFQGESCLANYETHQYEWISAMYLFYHHINRMLTVDSSLPPTGYHLTPRELQCIKLTSQGLRVEHIARQLKITPRTVNFHIQNANKKIGTNNKHQAAYRILLEDWDKT